MSRISTLMSGKVAATTAAVLAAGAVAAGATESLPEPAQDAFDRVAELVGADDLPDAAANAEDAQAQDTDNAGEAGEGQAVSEDVHDAQTDGGATPGDGAEFGEAVSTNAQDDGAEFGASVSGAASGERAGTDGDDEDVVAEEDPQDAAADRADGAPDDRRQDGERRQNADR